MMEDSVDLDTERRCCKKYIYEDNEYPDVLISFTSAVFPCIISLQLITYVLVPLWPLLKSLVIMKFQLSVAALAVVASAASVGVNKRDTPLSIKLESVGNSGVKIAVTNNGEKALNLLSKGTFLDEVAPVEKVQVYSAAGGTYNLFLL